MAYDERWETRLTDKLADQSWLDRVPLAPRSVIWMLAVATGVNALASMFTDYDSPWWVGFPLLTVFFLLLLRAARADKVERAAGEARKPR